MRILIDIGHPGHVHYFRNAIELLEQKGHVVLVTARDKEVTFALLRAYGIPFVSRGKGGRGLAGKVLYILRGDYLLLKAARQFKPDLFLSFASSYAAHASKLLGKPHIAFDDTEHAKLEHLMYVPFTDLIITSKAFRKDLGKKHIRFNGIIELCYLAPAYFRPDPTILAELGISPLESYTVVRFVSWQASHDVGQKGLTLDQKINLVETLAEYGRVVISSEGELPKQLANWQLRIRPEQLHHILAYARLYVGEGGTTATESALLGVPNIIINSLTAPETIPGTQLEMRAAGLQECFTSYQGVTDQVHRILQKSNSDEFMVRRNEYLKSKIDVTKMMVWLIDSYPSSLEEFKISRCVDKEFTILSV